MSFIQNLASRKRPVATPQAQPIPISLPAAYNGLASTVREPYRVNAPLDSQFSPTSSRSFEGLGATFRG